ncbi:MAG: L,D-transpeptidase family protein [Epsilonproteobacteria bacterium]|nr:L,D-transpeptidase family protein [Campylobacterota bacterium]
MKQNKLFTLLMLLFWGVAAFATQIDLLTQYRLHGIEKLEQQLDKKLTDVAYWERYLQDKDLTFGYIESYDNILTCNKATSTLNIYRKDQNSSTYNRIKQYHAFTGKMKGDKHKEGDLKTPVGVYEIVKKIKKVDPFYGPMAFVTSYPNEYDRYQHKSGTGIWIHGLPINQKRDEFTKGCIAIDNQSIKYLNKHIDIKKTILIINEKKPQHNTTPQVMANILAQLYKWRYAWLYNDLEAYLSFYDAGFKRFDGMDKQRFASYKQRVFSKNEKKVIRFSNINIIPYPQTDDLYQITFDELYKSNSFTFQGKKTLIVRFNNKIMKIITER